MTEPTKTKSRSLLLCPAESLVRVPPIAAASALPPCLKADNSGCDSNPPGVCLTLRFSVAKKNFHLHSPSF
jgi:hypothetical protein